MDKQVRRLVRLARYLMASEAEFGRQLALKLVDGLVRSGDVEQLRLVGHIDAAEYLEELLDELQRQTQGGQAAG